MHITFLLTIAIHLAKKAQIILLIAKKMQILSEYSDLSDFFLEKKAKALIKITSLNQYAIQL